MLVACEFSGVVRDAFIRAGHEAISCDLLPSEVPGPHHQGNVLDIVGDGFDLMIAHPPCTHLSSSGARWWKNKIDDRENAIRFALELAAAPIPKIAIENPVGFLSTIWRKPDQIIHPWQFGHGETKKTCLWLFGLPRLVPTEIVEGRVSRVHRLPESNGRWKRRSITYAGIAEAMAKQWGQLV